MRTDRLRPDECLLQSVAERLLLQAVHPYLAEFLKHAVAKDPVLPIRRRSPVPATAGVTRGPAAAAAPPATPALDGTDPEPAAPAASDDGDMEDGAEPRAENGAAMLAGGDAQDGARPAGRDGQPGAATACAPAGEVSMDCSSADDRATGTGPAGAPLQTVACMGGAAARGRALDRTLNPTRMQADLAMWTLYGGACALRFIRGTS